MEQRVSGLPGCVLSIAGSDSSAGAGLQADLKTCAALGVYAATAVSAITVQNSRGVEQVVPLAAELVAAQIRAVLEDLPVKAIKLGMLCNAEIVAAVIDQLERCPEILVVLDPVVLSSSDRELLDADGVDLLKARLLARAALITPNLDELALLVGKSVEWVDANPQQSIARLLELGASSVLLKGGHRSGEVCEDLLFDQGEWYRFSSPRLDVRNSHGTGCTLAAAIAAQLARGEEMVVSVSRAKDYLSQALESADRLSVGAGRGALNHFGW